jgi:hypothetical protein
MLVDQDRIAIGVDPGDVVGAGAIFVGLGGEHDACGFEVGLNFSHVFGVLERCRLAIPTGVKGEAILVEHPLEQADGGFAVAKDQLVLSHVAVDWGETWFFVKGERGGVIFDRQAD